MDPANPAGSSNTQSTNTGAAASAASPASSAPTGAAAQPAQPSSAASGAPAAAQTGAGDPGQTAGSIGPAIDDAYLDAMSGLVADILAPRGGAAPHQPNPGAQPGGQQPQAPVVPQVQQTQLPPGQAPQGPAPLFAENVLRELGEQFPGLPDKVLKPLAAAIAERDAKLEQRFSEFTRQMDPLRSHMERMVDADHARHVGEVHKAFEGFKGWEGVYGSDGAKLDPESREAKAREGVYSLAKAIAQRTGRPITGEDGTLQDAHLIVHRKTVAQLNKRSSQRTPAGAGAQQGGTGAPGQFTPDQVRQRAAARYDDLKLG